MDNLKKVIKGNVAIIGVSMAGTWPVRADRADKFRVIIGHDLLGEFSDIYYAELFVDALAAKGEIPLREK